MDQIVAPGYLSQRIIIQLYSSSQLCTGFWSISAQTKFAKVRDVSWRWRRTKLKLQSRVNIWTYIRRVNRDTTPNEF